MYSEDSQKPSPTFYDLTFSQALRASKDLGFASACFIAEQKESYVNPVRKFLLKEKKSLYQRIN